MCVCGVTEGNGHNDTRVCPEPPAVGQSDQHGGSVTAGPDCSEEHPAAAGMWSTSAAAWLLHSRTYVRVSTPLSPTESPHHPVWKGRVIRPPPPICTFFWNVCSYFKDSSVRILEAFWRLFPLSPPAQQSWQMYVCLSSSYFT